MRMDLSNRANLLLDMRISQAAEFKHIKEHYDFLMKYAL